MSFLEFVDLCSDEEGGDGGVNAVKKEPDLKQVQRKHCVKQEFEEKGSVNGLRNVPSRVDGVDYAVNEARTASRLPPAPVTRQFWKAGNYDDAQASKISLQGGQNHLRVHPKFLHSNATSHKWIFGAIAELLDNAVDEIQNGATYVMVDKISNPRDGTPCLLIQDDGGGMDSESIRHCMSFGFSEKKCKSAIGKYGNGFKTSTMRLGSDVIVFSRHLNERKLTQSVGLLSYTFLREMGHDRIVVPVVDYEFDVPTGIFRASGSYSAEHFSCSLSSLLKWSPYATESELLKQFDDIGPHGTKVIIYNLWFNNDGNLELDFESDPQDILTSGAPKPIQTKLLSKQIAQQHVATRLHYSLRVYSSILYLKIPENFRIILRRRVVEHHNLANDLKFPEFILYKPQAGGNKEAAAVTTIGFLKDAPHVNIHGFSVYHKNRLIMPFWGVVSQTNISGKGVAGVLEANFIEPTHNKQEFEKTSLFQKLEARLKEMTLEYWDYHCVLIGYQPPKKLSTASVADQYRAESNLQPVTINPSSAVKSPKVASFAGVFQKATVPSSVPSREMAGKSGHGLPMKRKGSSVPTNGVAKRKLATRGELGENSIDTRQNEETQPRNATEKQFQDQEARSMKQENKKLRAQCSEYEKNAEELNDKVQQLRIELLEVEHEYERLLVESELLGLAVEDEKT
ncbi:hypothetical protein Syun_024143 [Stephania yunnanensis]|uniref:Morc S5 domain-containing protein n=1 Tax=Stephania yunnanensis TaxID=152371 RepID=A0AAP0I2R3_9MAGN